MNLIEDAWIPVIRQDGTKEKIVPWQITEPEYPVIDIDAPRADFYGALYQFLIGLLQTTFPPLDNDEWLQYFAKPPGEDDIKERLLQYLVGFSTGVKFWFCFFTRL